MTLAVFCGGVALAALVHAGSTLWRLYAPANEGPLLSRSQLFRRVASSLLVAVLMVLVYVGIEVMEPHQVPAGFALLWFIASVTLLLVLLLALLDLRELAASRDIASAVERLRFQSQSGEGGPNLGGGRRTASGSSEPT